MNTTANASKAAAKGTKTSGKANASPAAPAAPAASLGGLGDLSALMDDGQQLPSGIPQEYSLDLIDEDPDQPRTEFDPKSLEEMRDSVIEHGVKTPISIRKNPAKPGRYIINFGARRYRGSILAGKDTIPAFEDENADPYVQVIENIQREALSSRDIAAFIKKRLDAKDSKATIAKKLGMSPSFVSQHAALLDLPALIETAFDSGRVSDLTVINELVKAYKGDQQTVTEWLANDDQEITRGTVKTLREFIADKADGGGVGDEGQDDDSGADDGQGKDKKPATEKETDRTKLKKSIVIVSFADREGRLMLDRRPSREGLAWMKYEDDGEELEADLTQVKVLALIEG